MSKCTSGWCQAALDQRAVCRNSLPHQHRGDAKRSYDDADPQSSFIRSKLSHTNVPAAIDCFF